MKVGCVIAQRWRTKIYVPRLVMFRNLNDRWSGPGRSKYRCLNWSCLRHNSTWVSVPLEEICVCDCVQVKGMKWDRDEHVCIKCGKESVTNITLHKVCCYLIKYCLKEKGGTGQWLFLCLGWVQHAKKDILIRSEEEEERALIV